jgi:hypothetical protein
MDEKKGTVQLPTSTSKLPTVNMSTKGTKMTARFPLHGLGSKQVVLRSIQVVLGSIQVPSVRFYTST